MTNLTATARRETCEEIGVCGEKLTILGHFPPFYIPASHHDVCPTIAYFDGAPVFIPNPDEVAEIFSFALEDLLRPRFKFVEQRRIGGVDVRVPYYDVKGHKVWGATAMLLSELEGRLRLVLPQSALLELVMSRWRNRETRPSAGAISLAVRRLPIGLSRSSMIGMLNSTGIAGGHFYRFSRPHVDLHGQHP